MGQLLWQRLTALAARYPRVIAEVRGAGLMLGLKAAIPNAELIAALREAGLLTVPAADNIVRLLPPMIIAEPEIDEAMAILEGVCAARTEVAA
jgi:acetylornithine/N-succinyldiaminopimelate aminotransferase